MHILTSILRSSGVRVRTLGNASSTLPQLVTLRFGNESWRRCATRTTVGSPPGGDQARSTPAPLSETAAGSGSISSQAPASASTKASAADASQGAATTTKMANENTVKTPSDGKIPDVPASSLGLWEEQDAKDPNKWKKFAWKYAGAVVLFLISYKTLHWYVDRMEAEGKRHRDELEEKKKVSEELQASQKRLPIFDGPSSSVPPSERMPTPVILPPSPIISTISENATGSDDESSVSQPQTQQLPKELLDQFAAPLPQTSSELDELYAYRKELETQLAKHMEKSVSTEEQDSDEAGEIREELASLAAEIQHLEKKKNMR